MAAVAVPAALQLISILANASAAKKQEAQRAEQEKLNKIAERRAAIERALGSGFEPRPARVIDPADISKQAIIGGISQLGAQIGFSPQGQKLLGGR